MSRADGKTYLDDFEARQLTTGLGNVRLVHRPHANSDLFQRVVEHIREAAYWELFNAALDERLADHAASGCSNRDRIGVRFCECEQNWTEFYCCPQGDVAHTAVPLLVFGSCHHAKLVCDLLEADGMRVRYDGTA